MSEQSNVILINPNEINVNRIENNNIPFVNGIPQYQDMFIFVELTAESKGRTVLESSGIGDSSSDSIKISLMGVNLNENDPNYMNFTTNYYDGSTGESMLYEGFGISHINININSSYVPQVKIQFIDVRGVTFFNQDKSPYRILFDFPPPTFKLTVKGYYGNAVTYHLHLVKYSSEFKSESGNFIIDAEFVAMTFAPLSDVLFRYIVNFPLIDNPISSNPNTGVRPVNTNDMLTKLRNLYTSVEDKFNKSELSRNYNNSETMVKNIELVMNQLNSYKDVQILNQHGDVFMVIKTKKNNGVLLNEVEDYELRVINRVNEFDSVIKSYSSKGYF